MEELIVQLTQKQGLYWIEEGFADEAERHCLLAHAQSGMMLLRERSALIQLQLNDLLQRLSEERPGSKPVAFDELVPVERLRSLSTRTLQEFHPLILEE